MPVDQRPHANKTDQELAALSQWLQNHLSDLHKQHESIVAEMRQRSLPIPVGPTLPEPTPQDMSLNYRAPDTGLARPLSMGDSYTEASRAYAMRITLAAFGIIFAILASLIVIGIFAG